MQDWTLADAKKGAAKFAADRQMRTAQSSGQVSLADWVGMRKALQAALDYVQSDVATQAELYPGIVRQLTEAIKVGL